MTMGAKRFGVGILAGLLLALAVVASSGLTYGTFGSFSAANVMLPAEPQGAVSTVTAVITTMATTVSTMSSTTGTSTENLSSSVATVATSTTANAAYGNLTNAQNPVPIDALYPSSTNGALAGAQFAPLKNLASGQASVVLLVFIPIAVALVLGLVLYGSSARRLAKD